MCLKKLKAGERGAKTGVNIHNSWAAPNKRSKGELFWLTGGKNTAKKWSERWQLGRSRIYRAAN